MRSNLRIAVVGLLATVAPAAAGPLKVGDPAPAMQIAHWVKGSPIEFGAKDNKRAYIVEFWATWCPPCIQSIPHLTELQHKYKDKLTIISITDEDKGTVKRFTDRQGKKMDYTIAVDDGMKTSAAYMLASGQQGIPTAFIVTPDYRVAWIGSPFAMDDVLAEVIAGKFDIDQAAAEAAADEAFFANQHLVLFSAVQRGDWPAAIKIAREVAQPKHASSKGLKKEILENIAWLVLTDEQTKNKELLKESLFLAEAAVDLTAGKDGSVLDTYALALFENDQVDEAIEQARKALDLVHEPMLKLQIMERLRKYESARGSR